MADDADEALAELGDSRGLDLGALALRDVEDDAREAGGSPLRVARDDAASGLDPALHTPGADRHAVLDVIRVARDEPALDGPVDTLAVLRVHGREEDGVVDTSLGGERGQRTRARIPAQIAGRRGPVPQAELRALERALRAVHLQPQRVLASAREVVDGVGDREVQGFVHTGEIGQVLRGARDALEPREDRPPEDPVLVEQLADLEVPAEAVGGVSPRVLPSVLAAGGRALLEPRGQLGQQRRDVPRQGDVRQPRSARYLSFHLPRTLDGDLVQAAAQDLANAHCRRGCGINSSHERMPPPAPSAT